jgi:hypothetical protein
LNNKLPRLKNEILKGLAELPKGGLVSTDKETIDKQKGILSDVVKQIAKNFFKGLSISYVSLPV